MTICFFGMYAPKYSRNRVLLKGLDQNGVTIIECNDRSDFLNGFRYIKLISKFIRLRAWNADFIFVGFPGQTDVPLAWLLAKIFSKKIVFDAFFSLYVSQTFDRKQVREKSPKALGYWLIDWLSCFLSDKVILDTNAHIKYFVKTFSLPLNKFIRVFVGTDTDIFKPKRPEKKSDFVVGFHGSYLPLQGVPIILQAAKLLQNKDIVFKLLGNGVEKEKCEQIVQKEKIRNVHFLKEVAYENLPEFVSGCDVYLGGPFGDSLKSSMVIPNKVYEALAMQKPVIVGQSDAIKELLSDRFNCIIASQGKPQNLASAILTLENDKTLREKISANGYNLIQEKLTPKKITEELIKNL